MVHRVVWRVGSDESLDFWADRLGVKREGETLRFSDPEGLDHELVVDDSGEEPLIAEHPEIPREHALQGFAGVRAYSAAPERSRSVLEDALAFEKRGDSAWEARGRERGGWIAYDPPPSDRGVGGAGTVHHVAWASTMEDHEAWRGRVVDVGLQPTPVIDRFWFRSVYFREPSGVLFELATLGPGFAIDEDPQHLGERLILPPAFEHLRDRIEPVLTPLPDPRASWQSR
jgi:glyoxalase family protein